MSSCFWRPSPGGPRFSRGNNRLFEDGGWISIVQNLPVLENGGTRKYIFPFWGGLQPVFPTSVPNRRCQPVFPTRGADLCFQQAVPTSVSNRRCQVEFPRSREVRTCVRFSGNSKSRGRRAFFGQLQRYGNDKRQDMVRFDLQRITVEETDVLEIVPSWEIVKQWGIKCQKHRWYS